MKFLRFLSVMLAAVAVLVLYSMSYAQQEEGGDKTLSPYFFVKSDDAGLDQMPLKSTSADVSISGVIADVKVTQVYNNAGKKPLEAIYIFPASTRAAVYGMKMTIGKRTIEAKIKKRDEARQEYEQAKNQGKSASLLEQQRPNVFQMNVANIMPGDEIKVELKYTELIIPEDKVYEFVYPTVVGPRYSNRTEGSAPASEKWSQNPYLRQGKSPSYTFDINVRLSAGLPIGQVACSTHKVKTTFNGKAEARVELDKSEAYGGNRDFILRYRLDGDRIQSGLLLSEGKIENFFLLMMQPPRRVTDANIPGREYIFIVDVSGSMHGFPLDTSKELMRNLIGNLRASDKFNVMLFSGGSSVMAEESLSATPQNIARAINMIDNQQGGGGTEILPALKRALQLNRSKGFSRTVVIVTDGYVTVEEEVFDLIRNNLDDANMFAFGIGSSVNRHLIEGIAHAGMGEPFIVEKPQDAAEKAESLRKIIASPVLTGIKVKYEGFDTYDVEPPSIPDVLSERPVIIFGKWRGKPRGNITLSGISGNGKYSAALDVSQTTPDKSEALKYLWARQRIKLLSDYNSLRQDDKRVIEVTDLGLKYNLLTAYTSFVAIDTEIRNKNGRPVTVKQPLPLPQGVSDYAVGGGKSFGCNAVSAEALRSQAAPSVYYKDGMQKADFSSKKEEKDKLAGSLSIEGVKASGTLSTHAVRNTVNTHINEIEACISTNNYSGKVTFQIKINADGTVKNAEIKSSKVMSEALRNCMAQAVKRWIFMKSTGATRVTFTVGKAG
jgi:Ca-activated chloride channel family protein